MKVRWLCVPKVVGLLARILVLCSLLTKLWTDRCLVTPLGAQWLLCGPTVLVLPVSMCEVSGTLRAMIRLFGMVCLVTVLLVILKLFRIRSVWMKCEGGACSYRPVIRAIRIRVCLVVWNRTLPIGFG